MNAAAYRKRALGLSMDPAADVTSDANSAARRKQVDLLLLANGLVAAAPAENGLSDTLLESFREQSRLLRDYRCPVDKRIEAFLIEHFADIPGGLLRLPGHTLVLPEHGVARELSLPADGDDVVSPLLTSYRVRNGVLHNPKSDRRTTAGTFHVCEGGLPIAFDKKAVPRHVFAALFRRAMNPPADLMKLPYTAGRERPAECFVSLLLRPTVCPDVPGVTPRKSMEVRFFVPGSLVSNLDFVESIFGNAGDPFLVENDAGLDVEHWTGHTGCVILAPHLVNATKKELGLPHYDQADDRARRDGMCWKDESELYNDGSAFKVTCRTEAGVIVTLIADNYYGYCKKEVKTQISYAANLYGGVEEEHAGGAIAFPSHSLGDEYSPDPKYPRNQYWADIVEKYGTLMHVQPEGYGIDKRFPDLLYVPETTCASVRRQQLWWPGPDGKEVAIPLRPGHVYMTPSGYKIRIEKHPGAPSWRLVGTSADGVNCHKPCTVSGGGKSEISKSLQDYMLYGPVFVKDIDNDLKLVDSIFRKDYSDRWRDNHPALETYARRESRPVLSHQRTLGSVIKLLTPSPDYNDTYNAWLASIPDHIYPIVFIIKRFQKGVWEGADWRKHFSVDVVNGSPGHELKYQDRKLVGTYLRVGLLAGGAWRTFKLRQDFIAAAKVQTQDDITASVTVPTDRLSPLNRKDVPVPAAAKFVENCEWRLFQRPDDAIHRGLDKQTEMDLSRADNFISNFEPLTTADARAMCDRIAEIDEFTPPMKNLMREAARERGGYVVCSSSPRIVDGKPTKNPRYLQIRPDVMHPLDTYVAERGVRFARAIPLDKPLHFPVDAVLMGRRNNPADPAAGIRGLAVYNPIHYQELPELFMDLISSLTGKSPSTTGAGSEGAMTKGPFNALLPIVDLNAALVSFILTGLGGFSTSAGHVGPKVRMDHDISLLVPEIWSRLSPLERDPKYMIDNGYLEPVGDRTINGRKVPSSRLGYRITARFVSAFFGRIFDNPSIVFDTEILKPETQDENEFADSVMNIVETHQKVARTYFEDGSIDLACPPLKALLSIMAHGQFEGKEADHRDVRALFTREYLLMSDWYADRLARKQRHDAQLYRRHIAYLELFLSKAHYRDEAIRLDVAARLEHATEELRWAESPEYLKSLVGTIGLGPIAKEA